MRVGQTSAVTFASKLLSSAAGFAATIYFARILGAGVLGSYYLLLSVVAWLALAGTMGFDNAITKRISEGEAPGAYKTAGAACLAVLTALLVVALLVARGPVERTLDVGSVLFVTLLLVVGVAGNYADALLKGVHLVHVFSMLKPVRRVVRTALQVGGVLLGSGLAALVYGYAVGGVVVVLIGLYVVGGPYRRPTRRHVGRLVDYAKYAWLGRLKGKTFNQADVLVLGLFVPTSLVGVYGITWNLASFLILFSNAITSALFPELSKLSAEDRFEPVRSLVEDSLAYAGLFTIPGLVGGLLLSERLLRVYGSEFVRGREVLWLLIAAVLVYGYQKQFVNALGGIDHPDEAFRVNAVLIVSNVCLNLVLVYAFGMIGAAVATATSVGLSAAVGYRLTRRHVAFALPVGRVLTQAAAAVGMGAAILAAEAAFAAAGPALPNVAVVGLLVPGGAAVYFVLLWGLSSDFRLAVRRNLPRFGPLSE